MNNMLDDLYAHRDILAHICLYLYICIYLSICIYVFLPMLEVADAGLYLKGL